MPRSPHWLQIGVLALAVVLPGLALAGASCYETTYGVNFDDGTWKPLSDAACLVAAGGSNGGTGATVAGGGGCPRAYVGQAQVAALNALNGGKGLDTVRVLTGGTLVVKDEPLATPATPDGLRVSAVVVEGTVTGDGQPDPTGAGGAERDTRTVNPGALIVGTATCPIGTANPANTVTFTFWADASAAPVQSGDPDAFAPCDAAALVGGHCDPEYGRKLLAVGRGGVLSMYGRRGAGASGVSWTHLAAPTRAGDTSMVVQDPVDWQAGDWVVVATTDFASHRSEIVRLGAPGADRKTLALDTTAPLQGLRAVHFGGAADLSDNHLVDERAEVGLLSRNVRLTADMGDGLNANPPAGQSPHLGGQLIVRRYFGGVALEGVEIEKFGQGGIRGTYPIHFHLTVDSPRLTKVPAPAGFPRNPWVAPAAAWINANSLHHSYTRCVTIHATNGLVVQNTVCARTIGHAFFLEDGVEQGNHLHGNLAVGAMLAAFTPDSRVPVPFFAGDQLAAHGMRGGSYVGVNVPGILGSDGKTPTAFWITHPANAITANSAAGCHGGGRGFWYVGVAAGSGLSAEWFSKGTPYGHEAYHTINGSTTPVATFSDNRAHGCYTGLDTSSEDLVDPLPLSNFGSVAPPDQAVGAGREVLNYWDGLTATRNRKRGAWLRPNFNHLAESTFATNVRGATVVSSGSADGSPPGIWSAITGTRFVGRTANRSEEFGPAECVSGSANNVQCNETPAGFDGYPRENLGLFGLMFYDGPARVEHVHFENFTLDPGFDANIQAYLETLSTRRYAGDAAIGWFGPPNQQSYAGTQYILDATWQNVDLRHQIFTERSGRLAGGASGLFDGDQNTVIRDRDGSLAGYAVQGATDPDRVPVVVNNLPFFTTPSTEPECLSASNLDTVGEAHQGQPATPWASGLVTPHRIATLVLDLLDETQPRLAPLLPNAVPPRLTYGPPPNAVVFLKDQEVHHGQAGFDFAGEIQFAPPKANDNVATGFLTWSPPYTPSPPYTATDPAGQPIAPIRPRFGLAMTGRVNRSAAGGANQPTNFEPKVTDGLGYTVHFPTFGAPSALALALMDADGRPDDPFDVRVGVCFVNYQPGAAYRSTPFDVVRRHYSFAGNFNPTSPPGTPGYPGLPWTQCPVDQANCPTAGTALHALQVGVDCTDAQDCLAKLDADRYFFDSTTGLLFFHVQQPEENGVLPATGKVAYSPAGTCHEPDGAVVDGSTDNEAVCRGASGSPGANRFWVCPKEGCPYYTIRVLDPAYTPDAPGGGNRRSVCPLAYPRYHSDYATTRVAQEKLTPVASAGSGGADACHVAGQPRQGTLRPWVGSPPPAPGSLGGTLGDNSGPPNRRDRDHFAFAGVAGERVTITLHPNPIGASTGEAATLRLKDPRGSVVAMTRGRLPLQLTATLRRSGTHRVAIIEDLSRKPQAFQGDYRLTLESSGGARLTLRPTASVEP